MTSTLTHNPFTDAYHGPINLHGPHFVGIGGTAMSGLARLCLVRGSTVSGSDNTDSLRLAALRAAGCRIAVGHDPIHTRNSTCVVYTAVTATSPEVVAARLSGIPVVHRAQALAALAEGRHLVAVSGTHGKSTTTGLLAAALTELGADPSYVIGADLADGSAGARHGLGHLLVAEADESDRSFHFLNPEAAIITSINHDHPENYVDLADHVDAYHVFVSRIRDGGLLVANADDRTVRVLVDQIRKQRPDLRIATYGETAQADTQLRTMRRTGWSTDVTVRLNGHDVAFHLDSPSASHAYDAVAALTALAQLGFPPPDAARALSAFTGVKRRFTRVGEAAGLTVVDSYADHPGEIAADLATATHLADEHKVIVVFQPSGYGRVAAFGRDMGTLLAREADEVILLEVHGGTPIDGVSSAVVADAITAAGGRVHLAADSDVPELVCRVAEHGDLVLTMGTGDVASLGDQIIARLGAKLPTFV
jgi:UDP-N-acetylmuramate--alanine ligase